MNYLHCDELIIPATRKDVGLMRQNESERYETLSDGQRAILKMMGAENLPSDSEQGPMRPAPEAIASTNHPTHEEKEKEKLLFPKMLQSNDYKVPSRAEIRNALLLSFDHQTMHLRHEIVSPAHAKTFDWIFADSRTFECRWDDFSSWLRTGKGIYWIQGKAASGKSTLMKYLCAHPKLQDDLKLWADRYNLNFAHFFFWNLGSWMQKSQVGLLCSILHQLLLPNEELLDLVVPKQWSILEKQDARDLELLAPSWYRWAVSELKHVLQLVLHHLVDSTRICLFIDGLDEFDGDHLDIVELFEEVAKYKNTKICISSRPLMVFENNFRLYPRLRLQDLTAQDIKTYARDKLSERIVFSSDEKAVLSELVSKILEMSSGVFLWVKLVVRSLIEGFTNQDQIKDLQRRLEKLPPELDDLFSSMLAKIKPDFYLEQASRLFQIMYNSVDPTLSDFWLAENSDSLSLPAPELTTDRGIRNAWKSTEIRLRTRCAGLLEVARCDKRPVTNLFSDSPQVTYLHLTVREFLEKPKVWTDILSRTNRSTFNAHVALLRTTILHLKQIRTDLHLDTASIAIPICRAFKDTARKALTYALKAEESTGEAQTRMMDTLERLLSWFWSSPNPESGGWGYFTQAEEGFGSSLSAQPESLDTMLIALGLTLHVRNRLQGAFRCLNSKSSRPLLEYAIFLSLKDFSNRLPNTEMISMLLQHGADPNEARGESTPWQNLLTFLTKRFDGNQRFKHLFLPWMKVSKLFLLHGANPNVIFRTSKKSWVGNDEIQTWSSYVPLQFINRIYQSWLSAEINELREMLIERGACSTYSADMEVSGQKRKCDDGNTGSPYTWDKYGRHKLTSVTDDCQQPNLSKRRAIENLTPRGNGQVTATDPREAGIRQSHRPHFRPDFRTRKMAQDSRHFHGRSSSRAPQRYYTHRNEDSPSWRQSGRYNENPHNQQITRGPPSLTNPRCRDDVRRPLEPGAER
jgi:hypothetical protein